MNRVNVSLPPDIRRELDRIAAREGVSRSDVLRAALKDYLFVRRFRALRQRMTTVAQTRGIFTDEDVLDRV
jgi:metal-responsive CopG/Arc/MetJ family transcriptional regulator